MEIEFVFEEDIKKQLGKQILFDDSLHDVKGLSLKNSHKALINLSAEQWKYNTEQELVSEISKTIVHEICHSEIEDCEDDYTFEGEETVCQIFAEQKHPDIQIEMFI